jgi:hypothetical protein
VSSHLAAAAGFADSRSFAQTTLASNSGLESRCLSRRLRRALAGRQQRSRRICGRREIWAKSPWSVHRLRQVVSLSDS